MKFAKLIQAAAIAAVFASGAASATESANLIQNGDFEHNTISVDTSNHYSVVGQGMSYITGWTVGAGSVDLIQNAYGSVNNISVDMLGTPGPGLISQSFNYAANTAYTLSFDISRNPNGSQTDLYVDFFGTQHQFSGTSTVQTETLTFTTGNAAGRQLLSFGSVGGDGYSGAVLDNVKLTAAVPEPETYAMLLAGLGMIGFLRRRKAKQAA